MFINDIECAVLTPHHQRVASARGGGFDSLAPINHVRFLFARENQHLLQCTCDACGHCAFCAFFLTFVLERSNGWFLIRDLGLRKLVLTFLQLPELIHLTAFYREIGCMSFAKDGARVEIYRSSPKALFTRMLVFLQIYIIQNRLRAVEF